ncbi:MAG: hypothetical protein M1824_004046 [Vezdaea acicularis]|nr:MAG: hypothetical protein M1824_004046 [Vezdaea acicularis]
MGFETSSASPSGSPSNLRTNGTTGHAETSTDEEQVSPEADTKTTSDAGHDRIETGSELGQTKPEVPLPHEEQPPLPAEAPPTEVEDDGWEPRWDNDAQAWAFYNRFTGQSTWTNPRVPEAAGSENPDEGSTSGVADQASRLLHGGYDPAIHGDYDPTAPYAQETQEEAGPGVPGTDAANLYAATGTFNRFTGKWQAATLAPENYNDENKSRRQMNAFFDVDAAANSHDGKSLKAERSGKKLTKKELKQFKEKRREKKEEKRRAWLRD